VVALQRTVLNQLNTDFILLLRIPSMIITHFRVPGAFLNADELHVSIHQAECIATTFEFDCIKLCAHYRPVVIIMHHGAQNAPNRLIAQ
jgi:hypothetical protein